MRKRSMKPFFLVVAMMLSGFAMLRAQETTLPCPTPVNLRLVGASQTTATVGWELSGTTATPSGYLFTLKQGETTLQENVPITDAGVLANRSYQFIGLTANTKYTVYLQSDCDANGQGQSEWSSKFEFNTLCAAVNNTTESSDVIYSNDFEAEEPLNCWVVDYSGLEQKISAKQYVEEGTVGHSAIISASKEFSPYIASPQLDFAANDMEVSFWYRCSGNTKFSAGVTTDPYNTNVRNLFYTDSVKETNKWVEVRFNTAQITGTGKVSIVISLPSGSDVNMFIDKFSVRKKPICSRPGRLTVDAVDSSSVTLSWMDFEKAGTYKLKVGEQTPITVTDNPYVLRDLKPNTEYEVRVSTVCTGGESEWSDSVVFKTRCGTRETTVFTENFDADIPECWLNIPVQGGKLWAVSSSEAYGGSGNSLQLRYGSGVNTLLVLQPVHIATAKSHDVSFMMYRKKADWDFENKEDEGVKIWVNNKPNLDGAQELGMIHNSVMFSPEVSPKETGWYYNEFNIPLSGTVYIIIEGINKYGLHTYIDDVKVSEAPKCRPARNIRIDKDNVTTETIGIAWDNHPASDATQFDVEVTTVPAAEVTNSESVNGKSFTIKGLAPATTYTITARVTTSCGDGKAETVEKVLTFATKCDATAQYPITQGFESEIFPPACWSVRQSVKGEGSGEDLGDNGWTRDSKYTYMGEGSAKLNPGRLGTHTNLVSPLFDCGETERQFMVNYWQYILSYGDRSVVRIWANVTPDTVGGTLIATVSNHDSDHDLNLWDDTWVKQSFEFTGKGEMYLIFEGVNMEDNGDAVQIDDVRIFPKPDCDFLDITKFSVDSIKTDAVRINSSDKTVTDWSVSYGLKGFDPEAGTKVRAKGSSVAIKGLAVDTEYEYYVQLHCGGGEKSGAWSESSAMFKTACLPYEISKDKPFMYGFEDLEYGQPITGCMVATGGSTEFSVTSDYGAPEGDYAAYIDLYQKSWIFRSFALKAGVNYAVGMQAMSTYGEGYPVKVIFGYGKDFKSDAMKEFGVQPVNKDGWNEYKSYFTVPADGDYVVGFGFDVVYRPEMLMDSITLEEVDCAPPVEYSVSDISANTAAINFVSSAEEWELRVASAEFDPETGKADVFDDKITDKTKAFTDLVPNTEYFYTVRSICDGQPSDWLPMQTFRTECEEPIIPWEEKFDNREGAFISCWEFIEMGYYGDYGVCEDDLKDKVARSGYSFGLQEAAAISPEFSTIESLAGYELSGWLYMDDSSGGEIVTIGVLNEIGPDEEFEERYKELVTIPIAEGETWYDFSVRFDSILVWSDAYGDPFEKAKRFVIVNESYNPIYFDDLTLVEASGCAKVQEAEITEVGSDRCTAEWKQGGAETEWQMVVMKDGERAETLVVKEHPATIEGLDPLTEYELYIRAICGKGDTSGLRYVGKFETECGAYPLPYDNRFNSDGDLKCWEKGMVNPTSDFNYSVIGEKLVLRRTSKGMGSYYTPWMKVKEGERIVVSFDARLAGGDSLTLSLIQNNEAEITRLPSNVYAIKGNTTDERHYSVEITSLLSSEYSEYRIAFVGYCDDDDNKLDAYIDNLSIEKVMPSARPVDIVLDPIGVNDVTVTINDTATTSKAWQYIVVPFGGDIDEVEPKDVDAIEFTVEGLNGGEMYDIYVRTGSGANASAWRGPVTFTTGCEAMPLPYPEGFEEMTYLKASCFRTLVSQDKNGRPTIELDKDKAFASEGECAVSMIVAQYDEEDGKPVYGFLILPKMELPVNQLKMKFDYRYGNVRDEVLSVGVINDPKNYQSFIPVDTVEFSRPYSSKTIDFSKVPQNWANGYIAFKVVGANYDSGKPVYIDNIMVLSSDYCDVPTRLILSDLGKTYAAFGWSRADTVKKSEFRIKTAKEGNVIYDGGVVDTNYVEVTDVLTAGTDYVLEVRSVCSEDRESEWVSLDFRTVNETPELPYNTGFEADDDNDQWILVNGGEANYFVFGTDAEENMTTGALYVTDDGVKNHYDKTKESMVYAYRPIHFTPGQYIVSYKWKGQGDNSEDYARVFLAPVVRQFTAGEDEVMYCYPRPGVGTGCDLKFDTTYYALDGGVTLKRQPQWKQETVEFVMERDTVLNIVVAWINDYYNGVQPPFAMDELSVEKVKCPTVMNLAVTAVTDASVTVSFRNFHEGNKVKYAVSKTPKVEEATITGEIEGSTLTISTNLEPDTDYWLFASTKCDDATNAEWRQVAFTTLKSATDVLPYTYGFEDDAENGMWQMVDKSSANKFVIGEAEHAGEEGTKSLYISNDGTTFGYDGSSYATAYAYRLIDMKMGAYTVSYDWKCEGEQDGRYGDDYARVFLAPENVIVSDGANLFDKTTLAKGCVALDKGALIGNKEWTSTTMNEVLVREDGKYKVVVAWTNDDNVSNTPVAVDNIHIEALPCAPLYDFAIEYNSDDSTAVSFFNLSERKVKYEVMKGAEKIAEGTVDAQDEKLVIGIGKLDADTRYEIAVQAVCSETAQGKWQTYEFMTECMPWKVTADNPYEEGFEDLAKQDALDNCWNESSDRRWTVNSNPNLDSYNGYTRNGKMNLVFCSQWSQKDQQPHYATRSFELEGGKYYRMAAWAMVNSGVYKEELSLVVIGNDTTVLEKMRLDNEAYSVIEGYYYAPATGVYDLGFGIASKATYLSLDDYSVSLLKFGTPVRLEADSITKTSAVLSWVVNAEKTHVVITQRDEVIADTTVEGTTLKVTGLTGATNYTAKVTGILGEERSGTAELKFSTDCDLMKLPYMQTFQTAYGTELPSCWDNLSGSVLANNDYNWKVKSEGDKKYAQMPVSGAYGTAMLKSPLFDVDGDSYALSFKYRNTSDEKLTVSISEDGGATFATLAILDKQEAWQTEVYKLAAYNGRQIVVAFGVDADDKDSEGLYVAVDDVRIACYGGEKELNDEFCASGYGDYTANGFFIDRGDIKDGTHIYKTLTMSDIENPDAAVCDTLKVLTLTTARTTVRRVEAKICEGGEYSVAPFDGGKDAFGNDHSKPKTEEGVYVHSYGDCDSAVVLDLKVLPKESREPMTICEAALPYTYTHPGTGEEHVFDKAGTHEVKGTNELGCEWNITLLLEVLPAEYTYRVYECEDRLPYVWEEADNMKLSETGKYSHRFESVGGCDSTVVIDFVVLPTRTEVRSNICFGSSVIFGEGADAEEISTAGEHTKRFTNHLGCDSIVTLILTVDAPIVSEHEDYVCENYPYDNYGFNIPVITKDTVLTRTIKTKGGQCDSTVKVNVDFRATVYTDSIASIKPGGEFKFCGSTYTKGGTYECHERTVDGCDSIIRLTLTVESGVEYATALPLVVAPNPVRGGESTYVDRDWTAEEQDGMRVEILNSVGQVMSTEVPTSFPIEIQTVKVSGIYYVRVITGTGDVYIGKLVVK